MPGTASGVCEMESESEGQSRVLDDVIYHRHPGGTETISEVDILF
jgi:proteasome lid subunit RPN8/RPN11